MTAAGGDNPVVPRPEPYFRVLDENYPHKWHKKTPLQRPVFDPASGSRYDPHAKSWVTAGTMSAHYSSNPFHAAMHFQACASPSSLDNPHSEWALHMSRTFDYLREIGAWPEEPKRKERENLKELCCTIL